MKRLSLAATALAVLTFLTTFSALAGEDAPVPSEEAMKLAKEITDKGASTFNSFNAKAMADTYLEDARIFFVSKEESGISIKEYSGRGEIEKLYTDLFKTSETIQARNHVEYAKLLTPDVLVISGTFDTNQLKADSPKIPFYQVRVKKGDAWLIQSLRIFYLPQK